MKMDEQLDFSLHPGRFFLLIAGSFLNMFRLSFILFVVHFCLAWGLRFGFKRLGKIDSDFASACAEFAEKIEFVLTQPGRWVCDYFSFSDDGVGF